MPTRRLRAAGDDRRSIRTVHAEIAPRGADCLSESGEVRPVIDMVKVWDESRRDELSCARLQSGSQIGRQIDKARQRARERRLRRPGAVASI